MLRLLCICFIMVALAGCAGLGAGRNAKYKCGEYTVEQRSANTIAVTDSKGATNEVNMIATARDVDTGDVRYMYSSYMYMYVDVLKMDKTRERLLLVSGAQINCEPVQ